LNNCTGKVSLEETQKIYGTQGMVRFQDQVLIRSIFIQNQDLKEMVRPQKRIKKLLKRNFTKTCKMKESWEVL